jgi:hypothetical protein
LPTTDRPAPPARLSPDREPVLAGFQFLRLLGSGSFGQVWLARHLTLGRIVAVKHLPTRAGAGDAAVREARVMAGLNIHRNRVTVFDLVQTVEGSFLILDYIAGGSLSQCVNAGQPLPWERAARYVADAGTALEEVHARGILHRDIKPDNLLWDQGRDEVLLTDFGLAARAAEAASVSGTAGYLAPEVFAGGASAKADVFALAATLFHLVTGDAPFDRHNLVRSHEQACRGLTRPVAALRHLPPAAEEVILAGLDPDPQRRPGLSDFVTRLRAAQFQALADRLRQQALSSTCAVHLRIVVATARGADAGFRPVALAAAGSAPDHYRATTRLRTGDLVALEISADAHGYLTVLNVSSSGEVGLLLPNGRDRNNRIRVGCPHRLTIQLTVPSGTERAVALWTRRPCPLTPSEWREQLETGFPALAQLLRSPLGRVRGMSPVLHETAPPPTDAWTVAVLELEHQAEEAAPIP